MQSEKSVMSEFSNAPHDFSSKNVLGRNVVDKKLLEQVYCLPDVV